LPQHLSCNLTVLNRTPLNLSIVFMFTYVCRYELKCKTYTLSVPVAAEDLLHTKIQATFQSLYKGAIVSVRTITEASYRVERVAVVAQTLQVPSLLTMQAPMGFAGVQAFMNMGHSSGLILPIITKWHSQPRSISLPCST
jgi:hypothetical protein